MQVRQTRTKPHVYYIGFDPGSGNATVAAVSEDKVDQDIQQKTIRSIISEGDINDLLKRGITTDTSLAQVLKENEYVLNFNGVDYYLGDLIREGRKGRGTSAIGDQNRYWSDHSRILLLTLAASIIPERYAELRVVTALPVKLYTNENRKKVKEALENNYRFTWNGMPREMLVKVGYVGAEGQGILCHCADDYSDQVVFDIGERTFDMVRADGQKIILSQCYGEEIGVGHIFDDLVKFGLTRKINLERKGHMLLHAYVNNQPLPSINGISSSELKQEISGSIQRLGRAIKTFISSKLADDGEDTAASIERALVGGGGAYYFCDTIKELIDGDKVEVVEHPEIASALGYIDISVSLHEKKSDIWELSYGTEAR